MEVKEAVQAGFVSKKQFIYGFLGGMVVLGIVIFGASQINSNYSSSRSYDYSYMQTESSGASYAPATSFVKTADSSMVVGNATKDRQITTNYLSAHVKSVSGYVEEVKVYVTALSGKVMNESINKSADNNAENGSLQVLIPNKSADDFLKFASEKAIKIVDRNVNSYQVSQQYSDIERELAQYEETYAKIKDYYKQAKSVEDLLRIQTQLDSTQARIDALKGNKRALDELSQNTQFTIYLSTNEYSLPYVPEGTFEVAKTFKSAVRSLVSFTDGVVKALIYVVVFVPVIAIVGAAYWGYTIVAKRIKK